MLNTFTSYYENTFKMQIPYLNFNKKKYFYLYLKQNLCLSKILSTYLYFYLNFKSSIFDNNTAVSLSEAQLDTAAWGLGVTWGQEV